LQLPQLAALSKCLAAVNDDDNTENNDVNNDDNNADDFVDDEDDYQLVDDVKMQPLFMPTFKIALYSRSAFSFLFFLPWTLDMGLDPACQAG